MLLINNVTKMKLRRSTVEKYITDKNHLGFANMASTASKLSETTLDTLSKLGDKAVNRELLAQILYDITDGKLEHIHQSMDFKDIKGSPYQQAINYCTRTGLLYGINDKEMGSSNNEFINLIEEVKKP